MTTDELLARLVAVEARLAALEGRVAQNESDAELVVAWRPATKIPGSHGTVSCDPLDEIVGTH